MTRAVISYDIVDDRKRDKVSRLLLDYGVRVQYSVFECNISDDLLEKVLSEIAAVIDIAVDSVRCYRLCAGCGERIVNLGREKHCRCDDSFIIV